MYLDSDAYRVSTRKIFHKMCTDTLGQRRFNYAPNTTNAAAENGNSMNSHLIYRTRNKKKRQKRVEIMFLREPLLLAIAVEWCGSPSADLIGFNAKFIYFDPIKINRKFLMASSPLLIAAPATHIRFGLHFHRIHTHTLILAFDCSHLFVHGNTVDAMLPSRASSLQQHW